MTTVAQVADMAQLSLGDSGASTWPQSTVEEWVREACRDYGAHFHLVKEATISCVTGTHVYDLPDGCIDIVLVEYPKGEDPPEYLVRRSRKAIDFWTSESYYDFIQSEQAGDEEPRLVVGADVATGESLQVTYLGAYYESTMPSAPTSNVYVPDQHIPILIQYVMWKAGLDRLNDELQHPDRTIRLIEPMQQNVDTQRSIYLGMIAKAKGSQARGEWTDPWRADGYDPVY